MLIISHKKNKKMVILCAGLLLTLQGCGSHRIQAPDSLTEPVKQTAQQQQQYAAQHEAGTVENNWLKTFQDPQLDQFANDALHHNPNLRASYYAVQQAIAETKLAGAALKPTVGYSGRVSQTSTGNNLNIGAVGATWELDVWGRISAQVQSARASEKAVEADFAFAGQSLAAEVAKAWFALIEATQQAKLAKDILTAYTTTLDSVTVKYNVGQVLRKDVAQAQAEVDSARDAYVQAQNSVKHSSRALELLLGSYPSASVVAAASLPELPPFPGTGVPAELLQRRPDLIEKEEQVRAAFFAKKDAELSRLPSLSLNIGALSSNITDFLSQLAAGITGPLYTGGAISAEIEGADAGQKKALAEYSAAVLTAFKDVETALNDEEVLKKRKHILQAAVHDYQTALHDTRVQYSIGQVDLSVVQTQQAKLAAALSTALHVNSLLLQNRINMYLALGGGFDGNDAAVISAGTISNQKEKK